MRKFLKNQKGVTMMEVLVTVALLAIVVVPCLSSFIMAQSGNVKAAEVTNAYTAAANLMEELKAIPSDDWENKIEDKIDAVNNDPENGNISVFYNAKTSYYEVRIYAGEFATEPTGEDADQPIIKGVIAP